MIKYLVAKQKSFNTHRVASLWPLSSLGSERSPNAVYAYYRQLLRQNDFLLYDTLGDATEAAKSLRKHFSRCNARMVKPIFKIEVSEINNPETYKLLEYKLYPELKNAHCFVSNEDYFCKKTMETCKTVVPGTTLSLVGGMVLYYGGLGLAPPILTVLLAVAALAYKPLQQHVTFFKPVEYINWNKITVDYDEISDDESSVEYIDWNKIIDRFGESSDDESSDVHESSFTRKFR